MPRMPRMQDNLIHGRFLAELTQEVFNDLEASKYQHTGEGIGVGEGSGVPRAARCCLFSGTAVCPPPLASPCPRLCCTAPQPHPHLYRTRAEYRISVYGRKPVEWDTLAAWVVQHRLYSDNNRWMIQVPRLYNVYKEQGIIENFEQVWVGGGVGGRVGG